MLLPTHKAPILAPRFSLPFSHRADFSYSSSFLFFLLVSTSPVSPSVSTQDTSLKNALSDHASKRLSLSFRCVRLSHSTFFTRNYQTHKSVATTGRLRIIFQYHIPIFLLTHVEPLWTYGIIYRRMGNEKTK